jgi:hypothetical protein
MALPQVEIGEKVFRQNRPLRAKRQFSQSIRKRRRYPCL